jgi:hypothetical protein
MGNCLLLRALFIILIVLLMSEANAKQHKKN